MVTQLLQKLSKYPLPLTLLVLVITSALRSYAHQHLFNSQGTLTIDTSLDNYIARDSNAFEFFKKTQSLFGREEVMVLAFQPQNTSWQFQDLYQLYQLSQALPQQVPGLADVLSVIDTPQWESSCAGKSYFHQESIGSVCVSLFEQYEQVAECQAHTASQVAGPETPAIHFQEDVLVSDPFSENSHAEEPVLSNLTSNCDSVLLHMSKEEQHAFLNYETQKILKRLQNNPFIQKDLISENGDVLALILQFEQDAIPASHSTQDALNQLRKDVHQTGLKTYLAGQARQQYETSKQLRGDIERILPMSVLLMVLSLFFSFRSIRGVIIPLGVVGVGCVWTAGIFSWLGYLPNPVTMVLPPLLICVGNAYVIFTLNQYYQEAQEGTERIVERMVQHITIPLGVTAITTIAGFAALLISPIPAIQSMGLFACVGVFSIVLLSLCWVPGLLRWMPAPKPKPAEDKESLLDRLLWKMSQWVGMYPKHFILFWMGVGLFAFLGVLQVEVNSDANSFAEDSPIMQDLAFIESHLAGTNQLRLIFQSPGTPEELKSPDTLYALETLEQHLLDMSEDSPIQQIEGLRIDKVYTPLEYLKFHFPKFPHELDVTAIQQFFQKLERTAGLQFFSEDQRWFQITIRMKTSGSSAFLELREWLTDEVQQILPDVTVQFTGSGVLASESANNIAKSQVQSVALALLIIFVILSCLFLSTKMGLVALYPNIVTISVFFGVLGWLGIPIGVTISVIAAIALGIGVDDTIHFLAHYNENVKKLRNEKQASELTVRQVGRPATFTTVSLSLGFGVFMISDMETQFLFGALVAFTLVVCWLADLNFLPSIMVKTKLITAWDYADLYSNPWALRGIPAFEGLSERETKLAILTGYLVNLEDEEVLFHEGEWGNELYIILEGNIQVYWDAEKHGEETLLSQWGKGSVFGEMSLFRQSKRMASARAFTPQIAKEQRKKFRPIKLLVLNRSVLRRLQLRYPRIATKLFLNLSANLYKTLQNSDSQFFEKMADQSALDAYLSRSNPSDDELVTLVDEILEDGVISVEEYRMLLHHVYADNEVSAVEQQQLDRLDRLIKEGVIHEEKSQTTMLSRLRPRHLKWLKKHGRLHHYEEGDVIWNAGEAGTSMMVVLSGKVQLVQQVQDKVVPVRMVFEGEVFGEEEGLFGDNVRDNRAMVMESVELLELSMSDFEVILEKKKYLAARLARNLISMLAARLQEATHKLYE